MTRSTWLTKFNICSKIITAVQSLIADDSTVHFDRRDYRTAKQEETYLTSFCFAVRNDYLDTNSFQYHGSPCGQLQAVWLE